MSAVTGMGGIGKTALAVEAAHRARAEGWFPGGFLFVDLRGYDDDPVTADQAVLSLLDAMGVQGADLPPTTARQYDAYRALLTERRERMLLILDNASDPSQYVPLLPGTDHHRVLITSRDRPDALPVRVIDLEALDPAESAALITRALHDADERDDRATREPDALRELTSCCGHLPLALQIAAAMLRRRRHRDIASLVTEIKQVGDPTVVLDKGSPGTDLYGRSLVLRPVLETSYHRLPADQARLLRLLSVAPGTETGTEAVAALADLGTEATLSLLDELAATHLVTSGSGRHWRLHDLVRAFGAAVVGREEGEAARERVLRFYHRWADAADDRLRWTPGRPVPERFADRRQALEWLDGERTGLVAAALWAQEERFSGAAVRLGECLGVYFDWRRYFDDWLSVSRAAAQAAHRTGDRLREAGAWTNLGTALRKVGREEEAIDAHTRARDLFRAAGHRHYEAAAWHNLGIALQDSDRIEEAIEAYTRARELHRATGNHLGEAMTWNHFGSALREAGRIEEAIKAHTRALGLFQAQGDRHTEADAWGNLGIALRQSGREKEAIEASATALAIYQEFEDWYRVGITLHNLAVAHLAALRPADARVHWLRAADAYADANAPTESAAARTAAETLREAVKE
ncbi:ATP-binding protein [Streptomyces pharetrae]|uniref:ATP-binding protein n=1 Tax=Streptomyces pharetrae TaxID=291370 RepID=UPI00364E8E91